MPVTTTSKILSGLLANLYLWIWTWQLCLKEQLRLEVVLCLEISFAMFPLEVHRKDHHRKHSTSVTWHPISLSGQNTVTNSIWHLQWLHCKIKKLNVQSHLNRLHLHFAWQRKSPWSSGWARKTRLYLHTVLPSIFQNHYNLAAMLFQTPLYLAQPE